MKYHVKNLFTISLLLCGQSAQAQNSIPGAGGNAIGAGGFVSYTIGQIVYTTLSESNGTIVQGVQQPYEISVVTTIEETKDISLDIVAYPNPATVLFKLLIQNSDVDNLKYQLYKMDGILLQEYKLEGTETSIDMSNYSTGVFILKVIRGKKLVKTFKIIKK